MNTVTQAAIRFALDWDLNVETIDIKASTDLRQDFWTMISQDLAELDQANSGPFVEALVKRSLYEVNWREVEAAINQQHKANAQQT